MTTAGRTCPPKRSHVELPRGRAGGPSGAESGEADEIRRRHAECFLALAESARPHLGGAEQAEWLRRLETERDNVRAALGWSLEGANTELGLRVATALGRFWWVRGPAEGLAWLDRTLERATGSADLRAAALGAAGGCAWFVGDHERSMSLMEQGLVICREIGDRAGSARMLNGLGPTLMAVGRYEEADQVVEEALAINRELGQKDELALSLHLLAASAFDRGDLQKAGPLYEESVALAREVGDTWMLVAGLVNLAEIAIRKENLAAAEALGREALELAHEIDDRIWMLVCLVVRSTAVARGGDLARAGVLWGAAERLDRELGENMWRRHRAEYEELLGERPPAFDRGVENGRSLSLGEAVEYALADD